MGNSGSGEFAYEKHHPLKRFPMCGTKWHMYPSYTEFAALYLSRTISTRSCRRSIGVHRKQNSSIAYCTDKAESRRPMDLQKRNETCLIWRENCMAFKTELDVETSQEGCRLTFIEQNESSTSGKFEMLRNEKKAKSGQITKRELELELENKELKWKLAESEKEKLDIKQKHEKAFMTLVSDNRKMNENLKEIQVHVRREKIESEQTKDEVERVLQEREKLIDEVKALTQGFERMIDEKKRMQIIIETSISSFDSKLHAKDEEIRDLQETIDNDRKQFMEERDEYLTVIESLKAALLMHENREVRIM
ncbi:desmoplakin-like [Pecten maximus]|uniref:desmoplakin-like n=1 Tax=Pecten maximus TaxID=6579 RepID=UPI0014589DDB|nr:desmoplakin-like [Pecten maximus]XP_033762116.1 desmoplakin-like [Pecten maximus]